MELARQTGAGADPLVRDRLGRAWIGLEVMRAHALRTLAADPAAGTGTEPSELKLLWSRWHQELGELAMDVLGAPSMVARGAPYDLDDWQRLFLFSRADTIYGGSDEIQRDDHRRAGARPAPPGPGMIAPGSLPPEPPAGRDLLAGKVVVVTAAAGTGIGSATARRCLAEGAQVAHQRRSTSGGSPRHTTNWRTSSARGCGRRRAT